MKHVDLQIQTTYSDGRDDMRTIFESAKTNNLDLIAITDHDTVAGIPEAMTLARESNIACIPGIEISVTESGRTLHMLAYTIDWHNEALLTMLAEQMATRKRVFIKNTRALNEALKEKGLRELDLAAYEARGDSYFNLPGVVKFMQEEGHIKNTEEGFNLFLPIVRNTEKLLFPIGVADAVRAVHSAGGKAVLSHALAPRISLRTITPHQDEWKQLIMQFKEQGLDGIELSHTGHSDEENALLRTWANELGLFVTYGTDWHGLMGVVGNSIKEYLPYYTGEFTGAPIEDDAFEVLKRALL